MPLPKLHNKNIATRSRIWLLLKSISSCTSTQVNDPGPSCLKLHACREIFHCDDVGWWHFLKLFFAKIVSFKNAIRIWHGLDPGLDLRPVVPYLGPNCMQTLLQVAASNESVKFLRSFYLSTCYTRTLYKLLNTWYISSYVIKCFPISEQCQYFYLWLKYEQPYVILESYVYKLISQLSNLLDRWCWEAIWRSYIN